MVMDNKINNPMEEEVTMVVVNNNNNNNNNNNEVFLATILKATNDVTLTKILGTPMIDLERIIVNVKKTLETRRSVGAEKQYHNNKSHAKMI
jgi:hypothetical protein